MYGEGDTQEVRCEIGDCVLFHPHAGTDFHVKHNSGDDEKTLRLKILNDDEVLAVAHNPSSLLIAGL